MMFARNAARVALPAALTALLGLAITAPALANAPQDTTAQPPAAMSSGEHPPDPDGLTNVEAMILDCNDMLNIIDGMRGDTRAMLATIDQANTTLTSIATLIDQINARNQQQGATPPANTPPTQTPPP